MMAKYLLYSVLLTSYIIASNAAAQMQSDDSNDIDLLINARLEVRDGKFDHAEQLTRDFLQKHPGSSQAHFLLGFILFKEGQAKAAVDGTQDKARSSLAEYTEGAKYHNPSSLDLKIVALDYVLLGDYADADNWLTRSLSWNPKDSEAWYYLGRIKQSENNLSAAVRAFDQSLEIDPLNTRAKDAKKSIDRQAAAH